jgi:type II secretion system (T2SS) protein G
MREYVVSAVALVAVAIACERGQGVENFRATTVEMQALRQAARLYEQEFAELPHGGSNDIVRALRGDNPKHIVFLSGGRSTKIDEFLDPWGRPYEIRVIAGDVAIRSAGANGILGDADDEQLLPGKSN